MAVDEAAETDAARRIRPEVQEALRRVQRHADQLFVAEDRSSTIVLWDDGDFRVSVSHGFPQNGRPLHHQEEIFYQHTCGEIVYTNHVRRFDRHDARPLNEYVVEEWRAGEGEA